MTAPKQPKDPGITLRNGKYQAKVYYIGKDGKRHAKSKAGFKRIAEARAFIQEYQYLALKNELDPGSDILLLDYFKEWYELYKKPVVSPRTLKAYEYTYNVIKKYLPKKKLIELDAKSYQKFLQKFGVDHAKATAHKVDTCIHGCIRNAVYDDLIKKDFIERTTIVYDQKRTLQIDYLNIDEMTRLTDHVKQRLTPKNMSSYMIYTAVYTGMRLGEIQGLQWRDINFNFKTISIKRAYSEIEHDFKEPKNETSKRIIRANTNLLTILKDLKKQVKPKSDKQQVFLNKITGVPTSNAVNKALRRALKASEINRQGFHFHSLRHTHVAYLLANQIDLYAISKRLGHADIGITSKVYSYMIDEYKVQTDDSIETALQKIENNLRTAPAKAQ